MKREKRNEEREKRMKLKRSTLIGKLQKLVLNEK